jgi:hypothetical protein
MNQEIFFKITEWKEIFANISGEVLDPALLFSWDLLCLVFTLVSPL